MSIKHHRQRFSAALRMPEHAAFTVRLRGVGGGGNGFLYCEVLMIGTENFCISAGKADEILDNIEQPRLVKHSFNKGVELGKLRVLVAAVFCFPLHEAVFTCGYRSSF